MGSAVKENGPAGNEIRPPWNATEGLGGHQGHLIRGKGSIIFFPVPNSEKRPLELLKGRKPPKSQISKEFACAELYFKRPVNSMSNVEGLANRGLNIKISQIWDGFCQMVS